MFKIFLGSRVPAGNPAPSPAQAAVVLTGTTTVLAFTILMPDEP